MRFFSEIANKLSAIVIFYLYTRYLGVIGYGLNVQLNAIVTVLISISSLGVIFQIINQSDNGDKTYTSNLFWTNLITIVALSMIVVLPMLIFPAVVNRLWMKIPGADSIIKLGGILVILTVVDNYVQGFYRSRLRFVQITLFDLIQLLLVTAGISVVVMTTANLFLTIAVSLVVVLVMVFIKIVMLFVLGEITLVKFKILTDVVFESLVYGWPIVLMNLGNWILNLSDRMFIGYFYNVKEVGVYSAVYTLAGLIGIFGAPFWYLMYPTMIKSKGSDSVLEMSLVARKYIRGFMYLAVPAMFGLVIVSKDAMRLLGQGGFETGSLLFGLVVIALFIDQMTAVGHYWAYMEKKPNFIRNATLSCGLLNVGLNLVLVPKFGILGAAWSTLAGYSLLGYLLLSKMVRDGVKLSILYDVSALIKSIILTIPMLIVVNQLLRYWHQNYFELAFVCFLGAGVYGIFYLFYRVIESLGIKN